MKRSHFCCLFVLAVAAPTIPAAAQEVSSPASAVIAGNSALALPVAPGQPVTAIRSTAELFPIGASYSPGAVDLQAPAQEADGGIKAFLFGNRRRTSNTLMIGGVTVAAIGVGVVKGEVGAAIGVLGLVTSIGGLYLAF